MEETDAWEEGRAKEDGEWARGGGLPDGAPVRRLDGVGGPRHAVCL